MVHFPQNRADRVTQGSVTYLDGASLRRPFQMPLIFRGILLLFVVAAIAIGGVVFKAVYEKTIKAPARDAQDMQYHINKEVDIALPLLTSLILLDDASISAQLAESGYVTISLMEAEEEEIEGSGLDLVKLPDDISSIEAGLMYTQIGSLSSTDAVKLLNGSWRLMVDRTNSIEMNVKYADFNSKGIEAAIENALLAEGLSELPVLETGVDGAGNTFRKGQVEVEGATYNWQISACPLSDVYSISGLPDDSTYVGIKMFL